MGLKVAIGMMWQENNTFSPVKTALEDFERFGVYYGEDVIERCRGSSTALGGFIEAAEEEGVELIPTIKALSWSGGVVERDAFNFLVDQLVDRMAGVRVDGVLLDLHGAMVAEGFDDADGYILERVREVVGGAIPVAVSFDLHANITASKIRSLDILVGYHTSPHVDMFETGYKAAKILFSTLTGRIKPTIGWRKIPMILPAEKHITSKGPFAELFKEVEEVEELDGVVSASLFAAQPWIDVPELGWSTLVITDGNPELADKLANQLAESAWDKRYDLLVHNPPLEEAVREAVEAEEGPVILVDTGDNVNAGAPGDSTAILKALLDMGVTQPVMLPIVDSESVEKAVKVGVGGEVTLEVGGKLDNLFSKPVRVKGRVKRIVDGRFTIEGRVGEGWEVDMGRTVVLEVEDNIHLLITESSYPGHDPGIYHCAGLRPEEAKIVVVKSVIHFKAPYRSAKKIIFADPPGLSTSNLARLPFKKAPRPLFPLDENVRLEN